MQPGIAPNWAQDSMLDVVQGHGLAADLNSNHIPRPNADPFGRVLDVANAFNREMVKHKLRGECVVQVDPRGKLDIASVSLDPLQ